MRSGKNNKEIVGRSTSFPSMSSLADLAFGRITRDEYRARAEQEVVSPVRVVLSEDDSRVAAGEDDKK